MSPAAIAAALAGRRVLVTGHTGFKGGWLCAWLRLIGAEVSGLALPPPAGQPSLFAALGLESLMEHRVADIREPSAVRAVFAEAEPEVVFHLAAQPLVRLSYREPLATYATNVMGTTHVLEAVRETPGVRAVVVVTSDKCYGGHDPIWGCRETDPMGGDDPYSSSKGATELVAAAYRRSFFAEPGAALICTARAGNVIGGGDWAEDRLVPDLARAALANRTVTVRNPASIRPWQHVLEPLHGYLTLAARLLGEDGPAYAQAWNFGPELKDAVKVGRLVTMFAHAWGEGMPEPHLGTEGPQPPESPSLKLDTAKALARLEWRPALGLAEAVSMTVDWYKTAGRDPSAAREVTLGQIEAYAAKREAAKAEEAAG